MPIHPTLDFMFGEWGGGAQTIDLAGNGIASAEAFGAQKLNQNILPSGIASAEEPGEPAISLVSAPQQGGGRRYRPRFILPIRRAKILKTIAAKPIAQILQPGQISAQEFFGNPALTAHINAAGIAGSEIFGKPALKFTICDDEEILLTMLLAA